MLTIFETERLLVRQYYPDDQHNFFLLNGSEEVMKYIRPAKSKEETDQYFLEIMDHANSAIIYGRWAALEKSTGNFIGSFCVIEVDKTDRMQLGYALLPQYWQKGYATELTQAGLQYVFAKTPIDIIYAYTEKENLASQNVLLKSGFIEKGERKEGEKCLVEFKLQKKNYVQ